MWHNILIVVSTIGAWELGKVIGAWLDRRIHFDLYWSCTEEGCTFKVHSTNPEWLDAMARKHFASHDENVDD